MEKTEITVSIETDKLDAITFYLQQKGVSTFQAELKSALEKLYQETVPQDVREYIEGRRKPAAKPKPKSAPKGVKEVDPNA